MRLRGLFVDGLGDLGRLVRLGFRDFQAGLGCAPVALFHLDVRLGHHAGGGAIFAGGVFRSLDRFSGAQRQLGGGAFLLGGQLL